MYIYIFILYINELYINNHNIPQSLGLSKNRLPLGLKFKELDFPFWNAHFGLSVSWTSWQTNLFFETDPAPRHRRPLQHPHHNANGLKHYGSLGQTSKNRLWAKPLTITSQMDGVRIRNRPIWGWFCPIAMNITEMSCETPVASGEKVTRNLRITLCPVQLPSWATPRYASHWKKALAAVWHVEPTGKNHWNIPLNVSKLLRTACQHPLHAKLQKFILDDHQSPTGFYAGLSRAKSQEPNGFLAKLTITTPI